MPYEGHSTLEVACGGDLEVVHPGYGSTGYGKVVGHGHGHDSDAAAKHAHAHVPFSSSENSSPTDVTSPAPVYSSSRTATGSLSHGSLYKEGGLNHEQPLLNGGNGNIEAVYGRTGVRGGGPAGNGGPPQERRIWGLKRNIFIAAAVAVSVFLLGTVITVVTVVMTRRNAAGAGSDWGEVAPWSRIVAVNFTDSSNVGRRAVFYQDVSGSLMMRSQDTLSNLWTSVNVTASAMANSNTGGLDVKRGTPMAVASNNFQVSLYYLSSSNTVQELYMPPNAPGRWFVGALGPVLASQAATNSNLAAYWHVCPSCTGSSLLVLWQDPSGLLQYANLTDGMPWILSQTPPSTAPSILGSGLAISPFVEDANSTDFSALRLYRQVTDQLVETGWGPSEKFAWTTGNGGSAVGNGLPTDPPPEMRSITYSGDSGMWNNNMVTTLTRNGTITVYVRANNTAWQAKPPNLVGGPRGSTAFSSLTVTQGLRIYGVGRDSSIHEYHFTPRSDPFTWTWTTAVIPGGG